MPNTAKKLVSSVIIPAKNESQNLPITISKLVSAFNQNDIPYEILVVNDIEIDGDPKTLAVMNELTSKFPNIRYIPNEKPNHGFGRAIQLGLEMFQGDCASIFMADGSDSPEDLVAHYGEICKGYDCVFGSRFMKGGKIIDYPKNKLLVNRIANIFLAILFLTPYDDFTNAFKTYSRAAVKGVKPFLSPHFSITIELPLKAIVRGYSYKIVPNSWLGQKSRISNLRMAKMASRYLYIALVVFLEKLLVSADYKKKESSVK